MKIFKLLLAIVYSLNTIQASNSPAHPDEVDVPEVQGQPDGRNALAEADQLPEEIAEDLQSQQRPVDPLGVPRTICKTRSKRRGERDARRPVDLAQRPDTEERRINRARRPAIDLGVPPHQIEMSEEPLNVLDHAFNKLSQEDQECLGTAQIFLEQYLGINPDFERMMLLAWFEPLIKAIFHDIAFQKFLDETSLAVPQEGFRRIYKELKPAELQTEVDFICFVTQIYNPQVTLEQARNFVSVISPGQLCNTHPMEIVATIRRHAAELDQLSEKLARSQAARRLMAIEITNPLLEIVCDAEMSVLRGADPKIGILKHLAAAKAAAGAEQRFLEFALAEALISERKNEAFMTDLDRYLAHRGFATLERDEFRFISQHTIPTHLSLLRKVVKDATTMTLPDNFVLEPSINTLEGAITAALAWIDSLNIEEESES